MRRGGTHSVGQSPALPVASIVRFRLGLAWYVDGSGGLPIANQKSLNHKWQERITEQTNPASASLDTKSTREILRIINREDQRVAPAVRKTLPQIARAVDLAVEAIRQRRAAGLFGRGHQRAAGGAGRCGVCAHFWDRPRGGDPGRRARFSHLLVGRELRTILSRPCGT